MAHMTIHADMSDELTGELHKISGQIVEEFIAEQVKEFEARLRREIAIVTVNAANSYSMERFGNDLVVRVKMEDNRVAPR